MPSVATARSPSWRWWVCGLLLLATMINYMDRLTLNILADDILKTLELDETHYGRIESGFALAFAAGAILFGFLVDRWNVFWIYPLAVLAWSAAGFLSGFANGFAMLLLCRVFLGLAESANWPCALRTTQRIMPPADRSMGNSILQSGAACGAILIPLVMFLLFDKERPETWRLPFFVIGATGALWVFAWWAVVRPADLALGGDEPQAGKPSAPTLDRATFARRFAVLMVLVVTINMTWHFLRAWGPLYLRRVHGYTPGQTFWFSLGYYLFTDIGVLTAGFVTMRLARGGMAVHTSRSLIFFACSLLPLLCVLIPFLPPGPLLIGMLMVVGFGSLGVFSNYYSFSQDLTTRSQGKVTGTLGCVCWIAMAIWQEAIGQLVVRTGSYTVPFVISGAAPLVGFATLFLLWGKVEEPPLAPAPAAPQPAAEERVTTRDEAVKPAAS